MIDNGEIIMDMPPHTGNPRNSEGAFINTKDGKILFIYSRFTGDSHSDDASANLAARFSEDKGETWSDEKTIITREEEQALNIMSVSLMRMQNGDIGLFYIIRKEANNARLYLRRSKDEGASWTKPQVCIPPAGYYVVNNDRIVRLSSGRILIPSAFHRNGYDTLRRNPGVRFDSCGEVIFFISDDDGNNWREGTCKCVLPYNAYFRSGLQEPGVIELKNGVLWAWARTDLGCQYEMFSLDMGETWTTAQPSQFTSPCSPLSMKRIPDTGNLLAVWNPIPNYNGRRENSPIQWNCGRTPLTMSISKDDGKTWGNIIDIENEPDYGYCYTAIHFIENSVILAYCSGGPSDGCCLSRLRARKIPLPDPK